MTQSKLPERKRCKFTVQLIPAGREVFAKRVIVENGRCQEIELVVKARLNNPRVQSVTAQFYPLYKHSRVEYTREYPEGRYL